MFLRPEISILNSSCPFSTVSPSATRSSVITPAAGELTGKAVCKQQHNYVNGVSWYHRLDIDPLHISHYTGQIGMIVQMVDRGKTN